jgi:hypothetical protein
VKMQIVGLEKVIAGLQMAERDIRTGAAIGLTRIAAAGKREVERNMASKLDRPTAWTMRAIGIRMASRDAVDLVSAVELKDESLGKGGNFRTALGPLFQGGVRGQKPYERRWEREGLLLPGQQTVAARGWRDSYGNLRAKDIVQITRFFDLFGEQGYRANMGAKGRERFVRKNALRFFVARRGRPNTNHLAPGIYAASAGDNGSNTIAPVVLFTRRQSYRKRINLPGIVIATAKKDGVQILAQAIAERRAKSRR